MNPSNEQLAIIRGIHTNNVVVDSVAGCGKTSTVRFLAMTYVRERILVLVYNVKQRKDTIKALKRCKLTNIDVHTFHSFGYNNYSTECSRDSGIKKVISANSPALNDFDYNIIIVDEVQDITDLYYELVRKIMRDSTTTKPIRILLLGDYMQSINGFNGAKIDYITNPEKYFPGNWLHLQLSETFRMTIPMVNFVNAINTNLGGRIMRSSKPSTIRPKYFVCNNAFIHAQIKQYLKRYGPQDILVLTSSTRKNYGMRELCNLLTVEGIPLFVTGDVESRDESMAGKLVISTIHAAKGAERKLVLVYDMDDGVLTKMLTNSTNTFSDAVIYVALTRALEELVIFHHSNNKFILEPITVREFCDYKEIVALPALNNRLNRTAKISDSPKTVTNMVKYLSNERVDRCMKHLSIKRLAEASESLADLNNVSTTTASTVADSREDVADINGFIVPSFHAQFKYDFVELRRYFNELYAKNRCADLIAKYLDIIEHVNGDDVESMLRAATVYCGLCEKLFYKAEQIANYDWLTIEFLQQCSDVIGAIVGDKVRYEVPANRDNVYGRIDAIDTANNIVYEFKCTRMLDEEHILQLALYAYIKPASAYRLLNIYTGEMLEISYVEGSCPEDIINELSIDQQ